MKEIIALSSFDQHLRNSRFTLGSLFPVPLLGNIVFASTSVSFALIIVRIDVVRHQRMLSSRLLSCTM